MVICDELPRRAMPGRPASTVNYTYHRQMALKEVYSADARYVDSTLVDAAGQVELRKLGGTAASPTLKVDTSYFPWDMVNGLGRLKRIVGGTPADTDLSQDLRYFTGLDADPTPTYDANGNLLNIYDYKAGSPQTQTFTYDNSGPAAERGGERGHGRGSTRRATTYNGTTGNLREQGRGELHLRRPERRLPGWSVEQAARRGDCRVEHLLL